jgi:hypothetical protein
VTSEFVSNDPVACVSAKSAGASTFVQCVETSVRGGNSLNESSRVCRALFPETI